MKIVCYELWYDPYGMRPSSVFARFTSEAKAKKAIDEYHKKNNYYPAWDIRRVELEIK